MAICILTTGGTIEGLDYEYYDNPVDASISIEEHLSKIEGLSEYEVKEVFSKDSRFINKKDRELLLRQIDLFSGTEILVTHGTLTMVESAQYIGPFNTTKTVIFTGAFILGTFPGSDAQDNLKFALQSFSNIEIGTYIAMHNTIFQWDNVIKNVNRNRFERITKW